MVIEYHIDNQTHSIFPGSVLLILSLGSNGTVSQNTETIAENVLYQNNGRLH